ncbi:hypothetical protein [Bacillus cereus group sp. BfR-BA-01331]|uniref:hypothetical protein n=1 Tax=Bacillus cereus group sp. BfR-BA-01331 TaxID=2920307 RepID=UPI001F573BAE|nr:hypothetical protein [Bacillus cereus group sp. BfR-BA-01331]
MCLYILEIITDHKISFLNATSTETAIETFQGIYKQYAEQVPFHVREVHPSEKIIMDAITCEIHCIGDNSILKKCLENLMHLHAPIDWVPSLELNQTVKPNPLSFTIHEACLLKENPQYNEVGIDFWESILQVSLHDRGEFWNALKNFLNIDVLSVSELEGLIKVKENRC